MLDRHAGNEVDLTRPQCRAGGQRIFHDAKLERVEVGQPWLEIGGIFLQDKCLPGIHSLNMYGPVPAGWRTQSLS